MTTEARPDLEARRERARKRAHELLGMSRLEHTSPVCTCDRVALELETHEATLSQVRMLLDFERAANGDLIKRATNAEAKLEALQRERDEVRDSVGEQFLQWRGVQGKSCKNCGGAGSYSYPDTSTWHRGMGGQSFTMDVCDKCWGSGDSERPWTNLRHLNTKLRRALKWDWKEIARRFARRAFNHRSNYREMVRENAKTRTERDTALADLAAAQAKLDALADKLKSANSIGSMFTMGTVRATEALMVAEQQRDAAITRAETAERDLAALRRRVGEAASGDDKRTARVRATEVIMVGDVDHLLSVIDAQRAAAGELRAALERIASWDDNAPAGSDRRTFDFWKETARELGLIARNAIKEPTP